MGAVLGLAAYGRTQEKLAGANNGGLGAGTTYTAPTPIVSGGFGNGNSTTPATGFGSGTSAFGAPATGGFSNSGGFSSPAPTAGGFGTPASTGFGSSTGFGTASTAPATAPVTGQVAMGFGGKPAPVMAPDPVI
jgi:hypothetical protein